VILPRGGRGQDRLALSRSQARWVAARLERAAACAVVEGALVPVLGVVTDFPRARPAAPPVGIIDGEIRVRPTRCISPAGYATT